MNISIICHRGVWKNKVDHNTLDAVEKSANFEGVEIDLKNDNGSLVLSHDPLKSGKPSVFLKDVFKKCPNLFYALNIKEDGLSEELEKLLNECRIKNYMCFDLSTPERVIYHNMGIRLFARFGDEDPYPENTFEGLVIDVFQERNWPQVLEELETRNPAVPLFIISPELHRQPHLPAWKLLKSLGKDLMICTDFPQEARTFFRGES